MRFFCYVCQDRTFVHGLDQPVCATCHSAFVEELESEDSELRGPSVAELYEDPDVSELAELWDTALSSVFGSEERTRAEHDTPDDQEADSEEDQDSENWVDEESDREAHYHHPGAYLIYAYRGPPPWLSDGGEEYEEEFDDEYETEEESDEFYDSYDDYDTEDDLDEEDLESVDMYSREDLDRLYGQEDEDVDWETEEEVDDDVEEEEEDQDEEEIYVETAEYNSTASGSEESEYTDAEDMHHRDIFLDANEDGEDEEYYGYSGGWHIHEHAIHDHSHHLVHFITSVRGFRQIWDAIYNDDDSLHPSYNGATDEEINKLPRRKLPLNHPAVDTDCTICHDKFGTELELINLPCRHEYHDECIRQWLTINASCPICRSPITPST